MSAIKSEVNDAKPHATSTTTPPRDTFHEVTIPNGDGHIIFYPELNGLVALYPDEYRAVLAEADEHSRKVAALQDANRRVTESAGSLRAAHESGVAADINAAEKALEQATNDATIASEEVKKTIKPLSNLDAKEGIKMLELLAAKKNKGSKDAGPKLGVPIYVKNTSLKTALAEKRIYLLDGEKEKPPAEKIFKDGKVDPVALKRKIADKVQDKAAFTKKWKWKPENADEFSWALQEFTSTMNAELRNDPTRKCDFSAAAQLMRFTAGAGLEVNFKPFKGNLEDQRDRNWAKKIVRGAKSGELGIKANAKASMALAEGRVSTSLYVPHFAGWHATATLPHGVLELGYWRCELDVVLSGSVGASVLIEADIGVTYTGGKQGVHGIPSANKDKSGVKARVAAGTEIDVFAGVRIGADVTGVLQWLNPEGAISNGKPLKTKPNDAVAEYKDVAKVHAGVAYLLGAGVKWAFHVRHESGKFVVYYKMGASLGQGAETSLKFEVGGETIGEFFKCIAYQLKRADYRMIVELIDRTAYKMLCFIYYLMTVAARPIEEFAGMAQRDLLQAYTATSEAIDQAIRAGTQEAESFVLRIRNELRKSSGSWLTYMPPETLGKIQHQLVSAADTLDSNVRVESQEAVALALAAAQTPNHLQTIAERMTNNLGDKQNADLGFAMIDRCLARTTDADACAKAKRRLAGAEPFLSAAFVWNDQPEFITARLGVEHPMYVA